MRQRDEGARGRSGATDRTHVLRDQHTVLAQHASALARLVASPDVLSANADDARAALARLAGALSVHLAMEDRVMYPKLFAHPDPKVAAIAHAFVEEMGGLREHFTAYVARWPDAASIRSTPHDFARETTGVLDALTRRVQREDDELYPLVDRG